MKNSRLHAFVSRGPLRGEVLFPHKHEDRRYVVSPTRFEKDYHRLDTETDIAGWLAKGYSMRMSNPERGIGSRRLISPKAIVGWRLPQ